MARKYLEEIGIKVEDTPWGYGYEDDEREDRWQKEREEIGFDERETWSLDHTMNLLLYERLRRYKELAEKIINLDFHTFKYNDEELTERQCIERILEGLELELTLDEYDKRRQEDEYIKERIGSIWKIYDLIKYALWW
jgi:hypothetical protein